MPRKPDVHKKERYNDPFPTRLRKLIEIHGTKQDELKEVLELKNRQSVTGYIDGETLPTIDKVVAVANHFHVSADWLLGLSEIRSPDTSIQAAVAVTGLSEKALKNIIRYFKTSVSPELQEEFGAKSISDLSLLLESDKFLRIVPCIVDLFLSRNMCAKAISVLSENQFDRVSYWDESDEMIFYSHVAKRDESGNIVVEDVSPEDITPDELSDIALNHLYEWFPELRMQVFELSEMWSEFLESLVPTRELIAAGKQLIQELEDKQLREYISSCADSKG